MRPKVGKYKVVADEVVVVMISMETWRSEGLHITGFRMYYN